VAIGCVTLLVTIQFFLADPGVRARLNFLDYLEGTPLTTMEALRPAGAGAVARLDPVLPDDLRGWLVLESQPEPGLGVLVNGRRVGDLGRGTLVVIVRHQDRVELESIGLHRPVVVRLTAVSRWVRSPQAGAAVTVPSGGVARVGEIAVKR